MSKPAATTKTVKADPRVKVLTEEYVRIHTLRPDMETGAAKAVATRTLQRLWDGIRQLDPNALADLPPIRSNAKPSLISTDAADVLAALAAATE